MEYINEELRNCHIEYLKLLEQWDIALKKVNNANFFNKRKLQKEYENAGKIFNEFSRNVYAKVIYDTYSKIKPSLKRIKTGEHYSWDNVFKSSFEELDSLDRSILVSLLEDSGGYKICDIIT